MVKSAYLKSKDIGKGWRGGKPKDYLGESKSRAKPLEFCPGHESAYFRALRDQVANVGNSYQSDSGYVEVDVSTFAVAPDNASLRTALTDDVKNCKEFKIEQNEGTVFYYADALDRKVSKVANGDMVAAYIQKIYTDKKRKKLQSTIFVASAATDRGLVRVYFSTYPNTRVGYDMNDAVKILGDQLGSLSEALSN